MNLTGFLKPRSRLHVASFFDHGFYHFAAVRKGEFTVLEQFPLGLLKKLSPLIGLGPCSPLVNQKNSHLLTTRKRTVTCRQDKLGLVLGWYPLINQSKLFHLANQTE